MTASQLAGHVRTPDAVELRRARNCLMSDGFCRIPRVLDDHLVVQLADEIGQRVDAMRAAGGAEWHFDPAGHLIGVANLDRYSDLSFDLSRSAALTTIVESLLDGRSVPLTTELFSKPAGSTAATPPHQDQVFYQEYFTDELGLTLWCPLTDVGPDDAPLEYARQRVDVGHLLEHVTAPVFGSRLAEPDGFAFRTVPASAGDVIAHHAYSVHRSAANRSGRDRVALGFSYRTSTVRAGTLTRDATTTG